MSASRNPETEDDARVAARIRASFAKQKVMQLLGAELTSVRRGEVEMSLPFRDELTQQHGLLHAGVITTILDSACGYAALSVMPEGAGVLSIEFKTNLLAPATGALFVARGRVVRAGRTIVVCSGDVVARGGPEDEPVSVATMLATMMAVQGRPGITD